MVDCAGLENRRPVRVRGFESHLLRRHPGFRWERQSYPMHGFFLFLAICQASVTLVGSLHAGSVYYDPKVSPAADDMETAFRTGAFDLQFALGPEISIQQTSALRPNIDYGLAVLRVGNMLDTVRGSGFFRGNDEVMLEAIGGPIYTGPGSALGGLSLMYRRNFVPPGARIIPYFDVGAGGVYSDAYHQKVQRALGSPFEFDLQAGLGLRYRISAKWSLDGEASYRHLSNANFASRNYGTNGFGGLVGFSYAF